MNRRLRKFISVTVLAAMASAPVGAQTAGITLAPADQQKLGVETQALVATTIQASVPAFVRVLDPGALAVLDGDLATAQAAAAASGNERDRQARLAAADASASTKAAEAAAAQASADAARLLSLQRRLAIEWAPALAALKPGERGALIDDLVAGRAALIRADALGASAITAGEVLVLADGGAPLRASFLGRAGSADPRLRTLGVLAVLRGAGVDRLPPGAACAGRIEQGGARAGVVIPRSAVIRLEGADWAYLQTAEARFERREIAGAVKTPEGWFVSQGFAAGERLAVQGAGSLLGVERADESAEAD